MKYTIYEYRYIYDDDEIKLIIMEMNNIDCTDVGLIKSQPLLDKSFLKFLQIKERK